MNPNARPKPPAPDYGFIEELRSLGFKKIIGIDEVGRGALAGPIIVAAVELNVPIEEVHDSKLIRRAQREVLSEQIYRAAAQRSLAWATNEEIDRLGLTVALDLAYQRCLGQIENDIVLTDRYKLSGIKHISSVKGDQLFYPVAAASILAKAYRDHLMSVYARFFAHYGWKENAGYGTAKHFDAIHKHGTSPLHRQSFLKR